MKVLLHGGYPGHWEGADDDVPLFQSLISAARESDQQVFMALLAYDTPSAFPLTQHIQSKFHKLAPDISITFGCRESLEQNLANHRVVFFQGGNTLKQLDALADISKAQISTNKTLVSGSSAGAMVLCTYSASRSTNGQAVTGRGILDFGIIPHANARPVDEYLPRLKAKGCDTVHMLDETQMLTFDIRR